MRDGEEWKKTLDQFSRGCLSYYTFEKHTPKTNNITARNFSIIIKRSNNCN